MCVCMYIYAMVPYNDICKIYEISLITKYYLRMSTFILNSVYQRLKMANVWPKNVAYVINIINLLFLTEI